MPDARWDVYALGALLYQMLTGHAPGRQDGTERVLRQAGTTEERLAAYRQLLTQARLRRSIAACRVLINA